MFRARVVNPRWIAAMRRHGYKGAFELAATVDYLFGYDATAGVVADWMYDTLAQTYVLDEENQKFFEQSNPWALHGIAERSWRPPTAACGNTPTRPRWTACARCTCARRVTSRIDSPGRPLPDRRVSRFRFVRMFGRRSRTWT